MTPPLSHRPPFAPRLAPVGRIRALGRRTMGLAATLTLVALVSLSLFAAWLSAPPPGDSPTQMAGLAATPTYAAYATVESAATPLPEGGVPDDALQPVVQPCTGAVRTIDDILTTLAIPYQESVESWPNRPDIQTLYPDLVPFSTNDDGERIAREEPLPSGGSVAAADRDQMARLYGTFAGCQWLTGADPLRRAAVFSDNGLIHFYWNMGGDEPVSSELVLIGVPAGHAAEQRAAEATRNDALVPQPGDPSRTWLWGFRTLADGRVAAIIGVAQGLPDDPYPATFDEMALGQQAHGYVVFVQLDGQWLIDELAGPMLG